MTFHDLQQQYGSSDAIPDDVLKSFANELPDELEHLGHLIEFPFIKELVKRISLGKIPLQMEVRRVYAEQTTAMATKTMVLHPLRAYQSRVSRVMVDFVDWHTEDHEIPLISSLPIVGDRFDFTLLRK